MGDLLDISARGRTPIDGEIDIRLRMDLLILLLFTLSFPFSGDIFNVENARPWEFKVSYPVRSICPIYLVLGAPLYFVKTLAEFCDIDVRSPYVLIVVPRLVFCVLSFVTDFSLYR